MERPAFSKFLSQSVLSTLVILTGFMLDLIFAPYIFPNFMPLMLGAVTLNSGLFGWRQGLLSTVLTIPALYLLLTHPIYGHADSALSLFIKIMVFVAANFLAVFLIEKIHQARRRAEEAERNANFILESSTQLFSKLDLHETVKTAVHLPLPYFSDYCLIDLYAPDGGMARTAQASTPNREKHVPELLNAHPIMEDHPYGPSHVIRTGASQLIKDIPALLKAMTRDTEALARLDALHIRSLLSVPLRVRAQILGVMTFLSDRQDRLFRITDQRIAEELAVRVAVALDNARLFSDLQNTHRNLLDEQKRLALQHDLTLSITRNMGEGVYTLDQAGRLSFMNTIAERILGWKESELLGKKIHNIIHFQDGNPRPEKDAGCEPLAVQESDEAFGSKEDVFTHKDGHLIPIAYTSSPIVLDGKARGIMLVFRDITEEKLRRTEMVNLNTLLEQRVAERTHELRDINTALESFSYSVSHDLRAPLRAIDGFSLILIEEYAARLDENGVSHIQRIRRAAQHMGKVMDALLELTRLTHRSLFIQDLDLAQLARDIARDLSEMETERQLRWIIPDQVMTQGDAFLLDIALRHLLENAWKFTRPKQNAVIELGMRQSQGENVYFVRDNGVGFDMTYAHTLFGPFQRLHGITEFEGAGIGLAMVQRIINRHYGRVWVDARLDEGATVYFTLPGIKPLNQAMNNS